MTRDTYLNRFTNGIGLFRQVERQTGWHLTSDHDRMAFYDQLHLSQGLYPSNTHPPYPSIAASLTQATIYDYLNIIKTNYNLHILDTAVHSAADSTNTVTSAAATTLASAITLANEIKGDFNAHIAAGIGGSHTHTVAAHTHDLFLNDAEVADGATTRINAGTDLLGGNTGGDIVVAGIAAAATTHGGIRGIAAGVTGAGGGAGAGEYHSPNGDNLNTILTTDATSTLAQLQPLVLEIITNFRQHLFIGPLRLDEVLP